MAIPLFLLTTKLMISLALTSDFLPLTACQMLVILWDAKQGVNAE